MSRKIDPFLPRRCRISGDGNLAMLIRGMLQPLATRHARARRNPRAEVPKCIGSMQGVYIRNRYHGFGEICRVFGHYLDHKGMSTMGRSGSFCIIGC